MIIFEAVNYGNLLDYEAVKVETSTITEMFVFIKTKEVKPMNPIESEIDAIEKTEALRAFHIDRGIEKSPIYYQEYKLQIMIYNDEGITRDKQHIFECSEGVGIEIILN